MQYLQYFYVNENGDTLRLVSSPIAEQTDSVRFHERLFKNGKAAVLRKDFPSIFPSNGAAAILDDGPMRIPCDNLAALLGNMPLRCKEVFVVDTFSQHGILPYNLEQMLRRLTEAFVERDAKRILRFSADIGHYMGDAHVPLHTTNYNGQLTGQDGLHAFWESRLPELFADQEYDFWVGQAQLIEDPKPYFWKIVLTSNSLVDSVIQIERSLRADFPTKPPALQRIPEQYSREDAM